MLNRFLCSILFLASLQPAAADPYIVQWQQVEPAGEKVMQACDTDAAGCAVDIPFTVSGRAAPVTARLYQTEGGMFHASFDAGGIALRNDKGQDRFLIPPAAVSTPYHRGTPSPLTLRLPSASAEQGREQTEGRQDLAIRNPYAPYLGQGEVLVVMPAAPAASDTAPPSL